ncbi:hypothetical protein [Mucilaginibacter gilvus]|uniref:Outer membrane protein beta-barrel domain-containing protein n=1 Tax=Mucilaginibacter gilvus TaxID=2305909 RepID=A0A444MN40_9SPHI|nr:hypothetical protein [Mucilaginibacter gilvus]RWY51132.1 hypothetical protein EPL05_13785 [Mucilaginibacter gilvus]
MKKILIAATLLVTSGSGLYAQQASPVKTTQQDSLKKDSLNKLLNQRAKSIYFEAAGPGSLYSVNYDTRFKKRRNGLGARIGLTYVFLDNEKALAVPFLLNYLFGKKKHFFEVGAGATYYYDFKTDYTPLFGETDLPASTKFEQYGSGVIGSVTVGYRYQPLKGGFNFRAGNSVIIKKEFLPFWPYVSVGYTFKNKPKPIKVKSS